MFVEFFLHHDPPPKKNRIYCKPDFLFIIDDIILNIICCNGMYADIKRNLGRTEKNIEKIQLNKVKNRKNNSKYTETELDIHRFSTNTYKESSRQRLHSLKKK